jgi:steroid 5-alpha reductase family enzyme
MFETYFISLGIILIAVTLLWIISVIITDASIVDLFWGMGFVITNAYYFISSGEPGLLNWILLILVTVWGLRLFAYLSWRNLGKGEDFRYQKFRQNYGPHRYWWVSYFQVFLLQGILIWIVSLPLVATHYYASGNESIIIICLALALWLIGFAFEAGGDLQLALFKRNPANKGKVLNTGFWKYTRHPNYFGDAAVWWSYGLFSISVGGYWQVIGTIVMTFLLIRVSGVMMLEKTLSDKPGYHEYVQRTSAFIPWFPKKG